MVAATPVVITKNTQKIFQQYYRSLQSLQGINRSSFRSRLERNDRLYQRETDLTDEQTQSKIQNRAGNSNIFQNIVVPVVKPQIEKKVEYQASVFLTGNPIFAVTASKDYIQEALAMNTIIEENAITGSWTKEFMLFFRNAYKHNFAPIYCGWESRKTFSANTDLTKNLKEAVPTETIWEGNVVRALDPYNTIVDGRVHPSRLHIDGEFAGWTEIVTRMKLKKYINELPDKIIENIEPAFASDCATIYTDPSSMSYYLPSINNDTYEDDAMRSGGTNWLQWAGLSHDRKRNIDYKDCYELTTLFVRILPSEFEMRVPSRHTPQIYKLVYVNHEHLIYCERQTNIHDYLPVLIGQAHEDQLAYQTKSVTDDAEPFQQVTSAYMNSIIASRRRAISDRTLYDPSRISSAHINSDNPSAKIPVRPAAYNTDISKSVYAFPYREDQAANSFQQIQALLGLANLLSGQNQASQGQFVKGNKTLSEYEDVMARADGTGQASAILFESQVFTPLKHILKCNILQYQGPNTLYNRNKEVEVEVDPIKLRKAVLEFKVADGLVPVDKLMSTDVFSVALQSIASSPQLIAGYNVAPMFSYLMKLQGATELDSFEKSPEQMAYEQALASWDSKWQLAIEKGLDPATLDLGPQPLPEQFGYRPPQQQAPQQDG